MFFTYSMFSFQGTVLPFIKRQILEVNNLTANIQLLPRAVGAIRKIYFFLFCQLYPALFLCILL